MIVAGKLLRPNVSVSSSTPLGPVKIVVDLPLALVFLASLTFGE